MEDIEFDVWTCDLDPNVNILLVNPDAVDEWKRLGTSRFDATHGFCVFGEDVEEPFIVVDSRMLTQEWFTQDHFLVIVAHELGHIHQETTEEESADLYGIQLLEKHGYEDAAILHKELYKKRKTSGWY